jgi:hypothetical protein
VARERGAEISEVAAAGNLRQAQRGNVVVDGAVVKHRAQHLVVFAEVPAECSVEVIFLGAALTLPFVGFGVREAEKHLELVVGEPPRVVTQETADQAQVPQRLTHSEAALVLRVATGDTHVATRSAGMGGFHVGTALGHALRAQVLAVGVFLRVDREVAGVIDRHAVHGESELICTKATNRQTTTEQTRRIVVEAVDAGQQGQCLVGVAGRTVFFRGRAGHRAAALRGVFIEDLAGPQLVAFTDDGDGEGPRQRPGPCGGKGIRTSSSEATPGWNDKKEAARRLGPGRPPAAGWATGAAGLRWPILCPAS